MASFSGRRASPKELFKRWRPQWFVDEARTGYRRATKWWARAAYHWKHGYLSPETGYWDGYANQNPWMFHNAGCDSARIFGSYDRSDPDVMDFVRFYEWGGNPYDTTAYTNPEYMHPELVKIRDPMEMEEWYEIGRPPVIHMGVPGHMAKYPWCQQQKILMRRWARQGIPPKPGNEAVRHELIAIDHQDYRFVYPDSWIREDLKIYKRMNTSVEERHKVYEEYKDKKLGEYNQYLDIHLEREKNNSWGNFPKPSPKWLQADRQRETYPKISAKPHWKQNYMSPDVLEQYEAAIKRGGPRVPPGNTPDVHLSGSPNIYDHSFDPTHLGDYTNYHPTGRPGNKNEPTQG